MSLRTLRKSRARQNHRHIGFLGLIQQVGPDLTLNQNPQPGTIVFEKLARRTWEVIGQPLLTQLTRRDLGGKQLCTLGAACGCGVRQQHTIAARQQGHNQRLRRTCLAQAHRMYPDRWFAIPRQGIGTEAIRRENLPIPTRATSTPIHPPPDQGGQQSQKEGVRLLCHAEILAQSVVQCT